MYPEYYVLNNNNIVSTNKIYIDIDIKILLCIYIMSVTKSYYPATRSMHTVTESSFIVTGSFGIPHHLEIGMKMLRVFDPHNAPRRYEESGLHPFDIKCP